MTCREKLAIERPEEIDPACFGGCNDCPMSYGYAKKPEYCRPGEETCTKCWDREVDTEVDSGIKDSGDRTEFETGALRDMHVGKGDMASLPWEAVLRL